MPTWHLLFYVKVCLQKNNHDKGNPLLSRIIQILDKVNRGYYMAAWGYEFYLLVLKVSLTSERSDKDKDKNSTFTAREEDMIF